MYKIFLSLLLVSLIAAGCNIKNETLGEMPMQTRPGHTNDIDTSTWKVYKNDQYGFELKYPGEWSIIVEDKTASQKNTWWPISVESSDGKLSFTAVFT